MSTMGAYVKHERRDWTKWVAPAILGGCMLFGLGVSVSMVVAGKPPAPAPVVAEYAEAQVEMYEAMYAASRVALSETADWSDEAVAEVLAAALRVVTEPTSLATWKPGYENWLRNTMGLGEQAVIDAIYAVYGARAWRILRAVSGQKSE